MSFILDALKKSDKKRQEASAPRLDTVHVSPPATSRRKLIWVGLLMAVLLFIVGFLLWLFSVEPKPPVEEANNPQSQSPPTRAAIAPQAAAPAQPQTVKQPAPQVLPQKSPLQTPAVESNRRLSEQRVYAISELPTATQRRIPALHMSLHAYNKLNPSAGLVRVNEQILRPGSTLEGKFHLTEIRADGAIFSFDGYRFLLPRRTSSE